MNRLSPVVASLFSSLAELPPDPILGLSSDFAKSTHKDRQNLGPGVYMNEHGVTPVLDAVSHAAHRLLARPHIEGYLPIDGLPNYVQAMQKLTFGENSTILPNVATVQAPGGTAAICLAAHLVRRILKSPLAVAIPNPTWPNHRGIFSELDFQVLEYPYYDSTRRAVQVEEVLGYLEGLPQRTAIILHACCHNPTGKDFSPEDWRMLGAFFERSSHIPVIDFAYQGFKYGLQEDAAPIREFVARGIPCFIASSLSKSFSLYSQRVGTLHVVTSSPTEAGATLSQIKQIVRAIYSNPPSRGAQLVAEVLTNPDLEELWIRELGVMRQRIASMRSALASGMKQRGFDFEHVVDQFGMFSFTGLTQEQVQFLKSKYSIFLTGNGRISVPALNPSNIEYVCDAFAAAIKALPDSK